LPVLSVAPAIHAAIPRATAEMEVPRDELD
jgi:hypothetical protein